MPRLPGEAVLLPGPRLRLAVADDDRAAVVGDTLRRVAARARLAVRVTRSGRDRLDLNVPPPDASADDSADVVVGSLDVVAAHRLPVPRWERPRALPVDPLAVRLLLLDTPMTEDVDARRIAPCADELARWRDRVGTWARQPSAPVHADTVAAVTAALDHGLDTVRALALLRALEADDSVPPGARMETFLTLDRLLGLDLALGLVTR